MALKKPIHFLKTVYGLAKPYWKSEDKWIAWGLLLAILLISIGGISLTVWKNYWTQHFYTAIQDLQSKKIIFGICQYLFVILLEMISISLNSYFISLLCLRWQKWLTQHYVDHWIRHDQTSASKHFDNPDQRIYQDLASAPSMTLYLFLGFFEAIITVGSFLSILWSLSGMLTFHFDHHVFHLYGYLLWCAIIYSVIGTWLSVKVGRPLMKLNYTQQRLGGNFRYELVQIRNKKSAKETLNQRSSQRNLMRRFECYFLNQIKLLKVNRRFTFFQSGYFSIMGLVGTIIGLPRFLARQIKFGGLMQISSAFSQVQSSLSYFSESYIEIVALKASLKRIEEFKTHYCEPIDPQDQVRCPH